MESDEHGARTKHGTRSLDAFIVFSVILVVSLGANGEWLGAALCAGWLSWFRYHACQCALRSNETPEER